MPNKDYYELHKERYSKQRKKYYEANKELELDRSKQYQKENREKVSKQHNVYMSLHPEQTAKKKEYDRSYRIRNKTKLLEMYGGKCAYCGETDVDVLTLDHVKNDMCERKRLGSNNIVEMKKAIDNYSPEEFQILCWNCNVKKHKKNIASNMNKSKKYRLGLKQKLLDLYGHSCKMCGCEDEECLTLDHIFNNGSEDRKKMNNMDIYRVAVENYSPEKYQILCANCNSGRKRKEK